MLEYDRVNVSKGTDANKIIDLCERNICHYCTFLRYILDFTQTYVMVAMI